METLETVSAAVIVAQLVLAPEAEHVVSEQMKGFCSMNADFEELIRRVRAGDADAAADLVKQFESAIRVAVRIRLFDPYMRRQLDSMDICQSVLASFFVRVAAGQYDLRHPSQLVAILTKMAHNKLTFQLRHHRQQRRDMRTTNRADLAV
jgi:hypothetical protein